MRRVVQQAAMPQTERVDYFPPPRPYEEETQETDLEDVAPPPRRIVPPRRRPMGEAKDIVQTQPESVTPIRPRSYHGLVGRVTGMIDDLDRAIEVKQRDLDAEGRSALPENHTKLGLLMASMALLRRTRAMLEDYGKDLDDEFDPTIYREGEEAVGDALKENAPDDVKLDMLEDHSFWELQRETRFLEDAEIGSVWVVNDVNKNLPETQVLGVNIEQVTGDDVGRLEPGVPIDEFLRCFDVAVDHDDQQED
jgi:hypothetical protein